MKSPAKASSASPKEERTMRAYADVGSHGFIFEFVAGPVAERYPTLLQIYREKITPDLVPVEIRIAREAQRT